MRRAAVLFLLYAPPLLTFPYVVIALLMRAGNQSRRSTASASSISPKPQSAASGMKRKSR